MKFCNINCLFLASVAVHVLLLGQVTQVVDASIFDFFLGNNGDASSSSSAPTPASQSNNNDGAGFILSEEEYQLGSQGFKCLQELSGVDTSRNGDGTGGEWGELLTRPIARVMLYAYGKDGIQRLCGSTLLQRMRLKNKKRKERSRKLLSLQQQQQQQLRRVSTFTNSSNTTTTTTTTTRQLESCQAWSTGYPSSYDIDGVYAEFAKNHIGDYFRQDDMDKMSIQRTDPMASQEINTDLSLIRLAGTALSQCSLIWGGINSLLGVIDVPIINQEAALQAIQSVVCDLPSTYNQIVQYRLLRDQEIISFHNELIATAEINSMYQNTKILATEYCSNERNLDMVIEQIDQLKQQIVV